MIPVLGIPFYNQAELLRRCVASIDLWVEALVIVDNSPAGEACAALELEPLAVTAGPLPTPFSPVEFRLPDSDVVDRVVVLRHPNAGVAGSWNEIVKLFPASWWLLANDDVRFGPGDLERLSTAAGRERDSTACFYANVGASAWVVTRRGLEQVGLFDENFHPAYLEDCDWSVRADKLGERRVTLPGGTIEHGVAGQRGSCTVNSAGERADACTQLRLLRTQMGDAPARSRGLCHAVQ